VPPALVTVMGTVNGEVVLPDCGGLKIVIDPFALVMSEDNAAVVDPKLIAVIPIKFVPVIVTGVPPAKAPTAGLMLVTVGTALALAYVNWSAETTADSLLPATTRTSTVAPRVPAGARTVSDPSELRLEIVASAVPK